MNPTTSTFDICLGDLAFDKSVNVYEDCQGEYYQTTEVDTSAWTSAVLDMTIGDYSEPVFSLEWSLGLTESCDDFVIDHGPCGTFDVDFNGNDNSTPES